MAKSKKRKYTYQEKVKYHEHCDRNPKQHGIKSGSPRQMYSMGFADASYGDSHNNFDAVRDEFGIKPAVSYFHGFERSQRERSGGK